MHPQQIPVPLAFIYEDAAMAIERFDEIESANFDDSPSSPATNAAGDPGGFGIGVLAEFELKIGAGMRPVSFGERAPEQQWRQNGSVCDVSQHGFELPQVGWLSQDGAIMFPYSVRLAFPMVNPYAAL